MVKVKICGLRSVADVQMVNDYQPDYVGFVFAHSKRQVDVKTAFQMKQVLHPTIQAVGVFVNEAMENIIAICEENIIDLVQLHGDEDNDYIHQLKQQINQPIIKAMRIKGQADLHMLEEVICDYFLFDTYSPKAYGGTGETFNWDVFHDENIRRPFFLAGGINRENVSVAMGLETTPYCIDISSALEENGMKSKRLIEEFMKTYKNNWGEFIDKRK